MTLSAARSRVTSDLLGSRHGNAVRKDRRDDGPVGLDLGHQYHAHAPACHVAQNEHEHHKRQRDRDSSVPNDLPEETGVASLDEAFETLGYALLKLVDASLDPRVGVAMTARQVRGEDEQSLHPRDGEHGDDDHRDGHEDLPHEAGDER